MRVKKYIVDSMPEALIIIRKELGFDAVILDQKKIKVGGFLGLFSKNKLEVIAAIEPRPKKSANIQTKPDLYRTPTPVKNDNSINTIDSKRYNNESVNHTISSVTKDQSNYTPNSYKENKDNIENIENIEINKSTSSSTDSRDRKHDQLDDKMVDEIKEIKNLFVKMMCKDSNDDLPDNLKNIYKHLLAKDIEEEVANSLVFSLMEKLGSPKHVADSYLYEILENEIAKIIELYSRKQKHMDQQQIFAFIGPTGVGKTTTIAKLAAYYVLEKKASVGFITADTYRIAAVDQLRTYANILNIPVEIVITHDDMKKAIQNLQERDIILIDTAGRNYKKEMHVTELRSLIKIANPNETFLVLSMTTKQKDMHEITDCFKDIGIDNFIFTKVDETSSYGAIINMLSRHKKSISFLTNGQNVPEDILFINPKKIAKLIVGGKYE